MTNVLALPKVNISVQTGNNEDWIDSLKFLVEDPPGGQVEDFPQMDLRGIRFEMEIRRAAPAHEVVLNASTDDGSLAIGSVPNFGYLIINIPLSRMKYINAGDYVGDVVASAENFNRVCVILNLRIVEGVTKWP